MLAHSNAAVDVLMSEVTKQIEKKKKWTPGEIVRYGYSQHEHIRNHETLLASKLVETTNGSWGEERLYLEETRQDLREKILSYKATSADKKRMQEIESDLRKQRAKIKEVEKEYIENAKVIGATLSKCAIDSLIYERTFDLVVVDEVSMAFVPQIALAASLGKRIVVCGDFYSYLQLRWPTMNSFENGLAKICFTMLGLLSLLINQKHIRTCLCCRNKDVCMRIYLSLQTHLFIKIEYTTIRLFQNVKNLRNCSRSQMKQMFYLIRAKWELFVKRRCFRISFQHYVWFSSNANDVNRTVRWCAIHWCCDALQSAVSLLSTCIREMLQRTKYQNIPVLAATVHKFQGSERDMMILIQ